jgi:hypothetical protein
LPASETSLRITEAYRSRLFAVRSQLERRAESLWPTIEGLDDFTWTNKAAAATQQAQNTAVALTGAYLTAFLTSEVGTRTRGPILDTRRYSGLSRDGRNLRDSLRSPMIGVRFKLKEGATPEEALAYGLNRAKRMVSVDYDHAHRTALLDGLAADERFQGWQRAVTGTCGACAGDIAVEVSTNLPSIPLQVHPNCQCVTEPVVAPRSAVTGAELNAMRARVHNMGRDDYEAPSIRVDPDLADEAVWSPAKREIVTRASGDAAEQRASLLHELGHNVDDHLLWTAEDFDEIRDAINGTRTVQNIPGNWSEEMAEYLTSDAEIWARAYSQWMAEKLGDREALERMRGWLSDGQWTDEDFAPIREAIDRVFSRRGWLN